MNQKKKEEKNFYSGKYFLGLDLGTNSLGWAVTDDTYKVIDTNSLRRKVIDDPKAYNKFLWGVRLFDGASTAKERREHRGARRRLARKHWRLKLLQEIFKDEIDKVDKKFYLRMKESRYIPDDKNESLRYSDDKNERHKYSLFADENYTDKEYHKKFPTIYHLRKGLIETSMDDELDIRHVYLAIHHILKKRGNFLRENEKIENIRKFEDIYEAFIKAVKDKGLGFNFCFNNDDKVDEELRNSIKEILKQKSNNTKKLKDLKAKIEVKVTSEETEILKLILGQKIKLEKLIPNIEISNIEFKINEVDLNELRTKVDDEEIIDIIEKAKLVYDFIICSDILENEKYISYVKVNIYEKHKDDLKKLKYFVKKYMKDEYQNIFGNKDNEHNYCAYIGIRKKCTYEEFIKFLDNKLKLENIQDEDIQDEDKEMFMNIKNDIANKSFLPKQKDLKNSSIYYQLHLQELEAILKNVKKFENIKKFLEEKKDGKTNEEKIKALLEFRIPYYVGPINKGPINEGYKEESPFKWSVRNEGKNDQIIYPWNFEEVIDKKESAKKFIKRMTNKCTILLTEDVLPKYSLLYNKFMILDKLNNLRYNGEKIEKETKQAIFNEVFCKKEKGKIEVTWDRLKKFFKEKDKVEEIKDDQLSGIAEDFKESYRAYHDFKDLGLESLTDEQKEKIILNITLLGNDPNLLEESLKDEFSFLTEENIKGLCKLSYKGWGRFSKKFLEEIGGSNIESKEEYKSIIDALWNTEDNHNQLLSKKYTFQEKIQKSMLPCESMKNVSYKIIDDLNISPAVKRSIWQTLLIVKEIKKVMGEPSHIFLEVARGSNETQGKKGNSSRKNLLKGLYTETIKNTKNNEKIKELKEEIEELKKALDKKTDNDLRDDRVYLYYLQLGKCMYTGKPLLEKNRDIDHIYPKSKVFDNSLDNRVLVLNGENKKKGNNYPIEETTRKNMKSFWDALLTYGLISKSKYDRLMRHEELSADELAGFIERQIVETRQSTIIVSSILKQLFPNTKIVYIKANYITQFRKEFQFDKVREISDFHHAEDAYLSIVAGKKHHEYFGDNIVQFIRKNNDYNLQDMLRLNEDEKATIKNVMDNHKKDVLITYKVNKWEGKLFNQTICKKEKIKTNRSYCPIKEKDRRLREGLEKYGGYTSITTGYFVLVESEVELKRKIEKKYSIETIFEMEKEKLKNHEEVKKHLERILKSNNPKIKNIKIIKSNIKRNTLFKIDDCYLRIKGRKPEQLIFERENRLVLSCDNLRVIKNIKKWFDNCIKSIDDQQQDDLQKIKEMYKIDDGELNNLYKELKKILNDSHYKSVKKELNKSDKKELNKSELNEKVEKYFGSRNKTSTSIDDLKEKCSVLLEILLKLGKSTVLLSKNLSNLKENTDDSNKKLKRLYIIYQSPTGIYETEEEIKIN